MGKTHNEITLSWLVIAKRDLDSAYRLATGPDPYLDTAVYHCQQAGEKAVKGFLAFDHQDFPKTHDIRKVFVIAETIDPRFGSWLEAADLSHRSRPLSATPTNSSN